MLAASSMMMPDLLTLTVDSPPKIDNISAKRRKFVNVVDPHIKKDGSPIR